MKLSNNILLLLAFSLFLQCKDASEDPSLANAPLFANLEGFHHKISTESVLAQRYFDQGMTLFYAFNYAEAIRSFRAGTRLDPDCAMFYWGMALSLGPHVNEPREAKAASDAYFAIQKALRLLNNTSDAERDYILALAKRYAPNFNRESSELDVAYSKAMLELAVKHPNDPDAATLFAESVMVLSPWNYWQEDGQPQPNTPKILEALERVLSQAPDHPGANHYFIHAVEAIDPTRALASADRLQRLAPAAGHLIHMPSHIYLVTGRYAEAATANQLAAKADEEYLQQCRDQGFAPAGKNAQLGSTCGTSSYYEETYYPHNLHFLWYIQLMQGKRSAAAETARNFLATVTLRAFSKYPALEIFYPIELFTFARFEEWHRILNHQKPPVNLRYATAIWHYARSLAYARTGSLPKARAERAQLLAIANDHADGILSLYGGAASQQLLRLADALLQATFSETQHNREDAIKHYKTAVEIQDSIPFTEPPAWYFPVRQALGRLYLAQQMHQQAADIYRKDLAQYPKNGWSLFGLEKALRQQGETAAADEVLRQFHEAWAEADFVLN